MCGYLLASLEKALQANSIAPTAVQFKALKYLKHLILLFSCISSIQRHGPTFGVNLPVTELRSFDWIGYRDYPSSDFLLLLAICFFLSLFKTSQRPSRKPKYQAFQSPDQQNSYRFPVSILRYQKGQKIDKMKHDKLATLIFFLTPTSNRAKNREAERQTRWKFLAKTFKNWGWE